MLYYSFNALKQIASKEFISQDNKLRTVANKVLNSSL